MFKSAQEQMEMFKGYSYDLVSDKIVTETGVKLRRTQFDTLFGAYAFSMDSTNQRTTRNASRAFLRNLSYRAPFKQGAPIELINRGVFLTVTLQVEMFTGYQFDISKMRVLTPDGMLLDKSRFDTLFGNYVFALDFNNERTTRSAWGAFTQNKAYRPPIVA